MTRINYTSEQVAQIDQLKRHVAEHCERNGLDPARYVNYLDNNPSILNDPAFQAYWQLASYQLNEIINPTPLQSSTSEIGEIDFDRVYSQNDPQIEQFMRDLLAQDPELQALANEGNATEPQEVLALINQPTEATVGFKKTPAAGLTGGSRPSSGDKGMLEYLEQTEAGLESAQEWALQGLAELDAEILGIRDMIARGQIDPAQAEILLREKEGDRATYTLMIQKAQERLSKLFELFSALIKAMHDLRMDQSRKLNVSA